MGIQIWKGTAKQRARLQGTLKKHDRAIQKLEADVADLEAELEQTRQALASEIANRDVVQSCLTAYDSVIGAQGVQFDPDNYYKPVVPSKPRMFKEHGELLGRALEALRLAKAPLSTMDVAGYVLANANVQSEIHFPTLTRRVKSALLLRTHRGEVIKIGRTENRSGTCNLWSLPAYANVPYDPDLLQRQFDVCIVSTEETADS